MKEEIEKVKKQLSSEEDSIFYIDMIYGIDEFKLEIKKVNMKNYVQIYGKKVQRKQNKQLNLLKQIKKILMK